MHYKFTNMLSDCDNETTLLGIYKNYVALKQNFDEIVCPVTQNKIAELSKVVFISTDKTYTLFSQEGIESLYNHSQGIPLKHPITRETFEIGDLCRLGKAEINEFIHSIKSKISFLKQVVRFQQEKDLRKLAFYCIQHQTHLRFILQWAVNNADLPLIKAFLDEKLPQENLDLLLVKIARMGCYELALKTLDAGADINKHCAFFEAGVSLHFDIAHLLYERGANTNAIPFGAPSLLWSSIFVHRSQSFVEKFLKMNVDLHAKNSLGYNAALQLAVDERQLNITLLLLNQGARVSDLHPETRSRLQQQFNKYFQEKYPVGEKNLFNTIEDSDRNILRSLNNQPLYFQSPRSQQVLVTGSSMTTSLSPV